MWRAASCPISLTCSCSLMLRREEDQPHSDPRWFMIEDMLIKISNNQSSAGEDTATLCTSCSTGRAGKRLLADIKLVQMPCCPVCFFIWEDAENTRSHLRENAGRKRLLVQFYSQVHLLIHQKALRVMKIGVTHIFVEKHSVPSLKAQGYGEERAVFTE